MAPSGPIQKTSTAPLKRVMAAMGELGPAAFGAEMAKGRCQPPFWSVGLAKVVVMAPSGPI